MSSGSHLKQLAQFARRNVEQMGCPCGARGESLDRFPHALGCPVDRILEVIPSLGDLVDVVSQFRDTFDALVLHATDPNRDHYFSEVYHSSAAVATMFDEFEETYLGGSTSSFSVYEESIEEREQRRASADERAQQELHVSPSQARRLRESKKQK